MTMQHVKSVVGYPQLLIITETGDKLSITLFINEQDSRKAIINIDPLVGRNIMYFIESEQDIAEYTEMMSQLNWLSELEKSECASYLKRVVFN